jgi:DNA-binding transcriptional ArsR family regulator
MVTLVKHEWHQVDSQFAFELDSDKLSEIYPELEEEEIEAMLAQIEAGEVSVNEIIEEAWENDVEIEWERQYDDWWTDRKGGYEVTYELGSEKSWHTPPQEEPDTDKCTKCRWSGNHYQTGTQHLRADGTVIEDYFNSEEVADHTIDICPMCDSPVELTEAGVIAAEKRKAQQEKWAKVREEKEKALEEENIDLDGGLSAVNEQEDITDEEELVAPEWPFPEVEVLPNYPAGEYTIRIWGRTREIGVGTISKEQYEHWSDSDYEDDLSDALNGSYDYDENETPENARFNHEYYEYQDVKSFWGFDEDDTHMTITNGDNEEIYSGTLEDFIYQAHGDRASRWEATEEEDELYPEHLGQGYFVMWTQGGKGSCIQTTIDTEGQEFDPRKFGYKTWDVQGSSVVHHLLYDGYELEDEGMDSDEDNWRGQWSEFSVHHNG